MKRETIINHPHHRVAITIIVISVKTMNLLTQEGRQITLSNWAPFIYL